MLYYKYILIPVTALQEGVTIMTKRSTKTLKIILFAGMFIWMVKFSLSHGSAMNPDTLVGSVFMASLVYLLATLFGLALSVSNNYIVAIVLTGILAFLFIFKIDFFISIDIGRTVSNKKSSTLTRTTLSYK